MTYALQAPDSGVQKVSFASRRRDPKPGRSLAPAGKTTLEDALFSDDLRGQSILGIGATDERYFVEALQRGAASAVGLETSHERRRDALARSPHSTVEYVDADIEEWHAAPLSYDVTLCLNVLNRLHDPIATIRKLMRMTRKRLFIEVAEANHDILRKASRMLGFFGAGSAPLVLLSEPGKRIEARDGVFTFTRPALSILMNKHTSAFEPIRFHDGGKNRIVVEARRRQIGHLVVVSGPTSVGKSSFVTRLSQPEMRRRFDVEGSFETVTANTIDKLPNGRIENLVYHYDMLRPFGTLTQSHRHDPAFDLLTCAKRVTVITLWNSADELRRRIFASEVDRKRAGGRRADRHETLHQLYGAPNFLNGWYHAWQHAFSTLPGCVDLRSFVVKTDRDYSELAGYDALLSQFPGSA